MQGGNVTASGNEMLCPTAGEITRWLWTGIAAGAEGTIFWTLNQRASALEAGEWGMLDFQRRPSDRLTAASEVARTAKANREFFGAARPVKSDITLLYNIESLLVQQKNAAASKDDRHEGRKASAVMKSLAGAYEAISAWGVIPEVCEMGSYPWKEDPRGKTVVLPNMVSLPSWSWPVLDEFVKNGGRLIATGLTGFYDENMHCIMMDDFPLRRVFGAQVSEYKTVAPYFTLPGAASGTTLPAHLWKGILRPAGAGAIATDGGDVVGTRHGFGKGEAVWFPSPIELGGWQRDNSGVVDFYGAWCLEPSAGAALRFSRPAPGVLMRLMESPEERLAVFINSRAERAGVVLTQPIPASARRLNGKSTPDGTVLELEAGECAVFLWNKRAE
jgi:beta-galactosidase